MSEVRRLYVTSVVYCVVMIFVLWMCYGCAEQRGPAQVANAATGTAITQAQEHIESAEAAAQKIRPHADKTGNALVDVVSDEHKAAADALVDAQTENIKQAGEIEKLQDDIVKLTAERNKYKGSWGYRAEIVIQAFLTLILIAIGIHFLAGGLALALPLFFPAAIAAVPVIKVIGAVCNPLALPQFLFDHVHLKRCEASPA